MPLVDLGLDYRQIGRLLQSRGPWRYAEAIRLVSGTCTCQPKCDLYEADVNGSKIQLYRCETRRLAEMFPEVPSHPEGYQSLTVKD